MSVKVGVLGAGAVGCHLGLSAAVGGADVLLVGRSALLNAVSKGGTLSVHSKAGAVRTLPVDQGASEAEGRERRAGRVRCTDRADGLRDCDVVLLCVKATDLAGALDGLERALGDARPVVLSCQNGFECADLVKKKLPHSRVSSMIVNYNIVQQGTAFVATTDEEVHAPRIAERPMLSGLYRALRSGGVRARLYAESQMHAVACSKTCTNLFNCINALSGVPVPQTLLNWKYRAMWALAVDEALRVFRSAGVEPANIKVPVSTFPLLLSLPDAVVGALLAAKLHPQARSSMLQDLDSGRAETEIRFLNLAVARLGDRVGEPAPLNKRLGEMLEAAARRKEGSPHMSAEDMAAGAGLTEEDLLAPARRLRSLMAAALAAVLLALACGLAVARRL